MLQTGGPLAPSGPLSTLDREGTANIDAPAPAAADHRESPQSAAQQSIKFSVNVYSGCKGLSSHVLHVLTRVDRQFSRGTSRDGVERVERARV
jgi:hypothetical protein